MDKSLYVEFTPSSDQLADIMTKPLPSARFLALRTKLTVVHHPSGRREEVLERGKRSNEKGVTMKSVGQSLWKMIQRKGFLIPFVQWLGHRLFMSKKRVRIP
ncbi:hypothetical protein L484_018919 [Morus notabilis]|uniref:Uncharacterized protein n=1 Tax=Morus notabilis TaxID=981085 RepID=W9R1P1_9ROSA|nr:hypothetical protein L484_018919 [Morus notabilis]